MGNETDGIEPASPIAERATEIPKRVLLLTPRLADTSAGRMCTDLALHLDPARFQPVVCCYAGWGPLARELEQAGIEIFLLRRRPGVDLTYMFALAGEMRRRRIDLVHSLNARKAYVVGVLSALLARVRGVASFHDRPATDSPLLSSAGRLCGEVVGRVVASSEAVRDSLLRHRWVPPGKTDIILDGVNLERFERAGQREAARAHWDISDSTPLIGGLVAPEDSAGLALLSLTFDAVAQALPEARFLVCGRDGRNTSRTLFLGPYADSPAFFRAIDHLCLPRAGRVVPLTLLEALAAEVPVTAGRSESEAAQAPEGPWAFANLTPEDPMALAAGTVELITDPHAAQALVRPGRRCVQERFGMAEHVALIQALYERTE